MKIETFPTHYCVVSKNETAQFELNGNKAEKTYTNNNIINSENCSQFQWRSNNLLDTPMYNWVYPDVTQPNMNMNMKHPTKKGQRFEYLGKIYTVEAFYASPDNIVDTYEEALELSKKVTIITNGDGVTQGMALLEDAFIIE